MRVVTSEGKHLLRTPLKSLLLQLDPHQFWQIHRGTIVRTDAIDTAHRDETVRLSVHLHSHAQRLPGSRLYAHRFKAL